MSLVFVVCGGRGQAIDFRLVKSCKIVEKLWSLGLKYLIAVSGEDLIYALEVCPRDVRMIKVNLRTVRTKHHFSKLDGNISLSTPDSVLHSVRFLIFFLTYSMYYVKRRFSSPHILMLSFYGNIRF